VPDLDRNQRAAVDAGPVDLFVSAGAGSGKTRVLVARFVSAVLGTPPYSPHDPGRLLTVTFTEKAAGELAERIRRELTAAGRADAARTIGDAWISTIHGMCRRILREYAFDAGIDPHFTVLDEIEAAALETAAFEESVGALIREDEAVAGLFESYRFDEVVSAARHIRARIRALGLSPCDVRTIDEQAVRACLLTAADSFAAIVRTIDALPAHATLAANRGAAAGAADAIRSACSTGAIDAAALEVGLRGVTFSKRGSADGLKESGDRGRQLVEEALRCSVQLLVAPQERAFLTVLHAFDERYRQMKTGRGALDFEDLQTHTADLLERDPAIAGRYRSRFAMLMIDEFQDTNELQLRIADALAAGNLCTVGDENQSIYSFRHADVEVFRGRARRVAQRETLDVNYRIAPPLLDQINRLFAHPAVLGDSFVGLCPPAEPGERPDWPEGQPRLAVRYVDRSGQHGMSAHDAEAECVAQRVAELVAAGIPPGDIAILMGALAGGRAEAVERALGRRGIAAELSSGGDFFGCAEVAEARALLAAIDNVWDDAAVATVLAGRLTALTPQGLLSIRRHADERAAERGHGGARLWDALVDPPDDLPVADRDAVIRTVEAIRTARRMRGLSPLAEVVLEPLLALDVDLVVLSSGPGGVRAWSNLLKLARLASEYEAVSAGDLGGFLEYLTLRETHAVSEQAAPVAVEADAVRVMSIHAAKGLEFPVVVVAGLDRGGPSSAIAMARVDGVPLLGMRYTGGTERCATLGSETVSARLREIEDAESRRLLYVACTRAEEALTIVARTAPDRDAGESLGDRVRRALGYAAADSLPDDHVSTERPEVSVRVVRPDEHGALGSGDAESAAGPSGPEAEGPLVPAPPAARVPVPRPTGVPPRSHRRPPRRVSYTGLAHYQECGYRFYLTRVARLPQPPATEAAMTLGSAVHLALERASEAAADVTAAARDAARAAGLPAEMVPRVEQAVRTFLDSPVAGELAAADRVMREAPIALPIAGTVLVGAMDAIAWTGSEALVVDYKTGTAPLTEAEATERYRLQGCCYALAALAAGASRVRVVFAEVERGRQVEYTYATGDRAVLDTAVGSIVDRMTDEAYEPLPSYEARLCEACPGLGGLCPVSRPAAGGA
jgi:ATP-dependent exoDNAse (exonuclease V) beta subunit